jgi:hypothetical protein
MHMKIAVEILLIWTALDVVVGIPIWMLIKSRDRREASTAAYVVTDNPGGLLTNHGGLDPAQELLARVRAE